MSSSKQQVVVMIDSELMDVVDAWSDDRTQAIEEALYLWCQHQSNMVSSSQPVQSSNQPLAQSSQPTQPSQPLSPAEYHRQRHDEDETGWLV